jgi:hypothetical protein
MLEVVFNCLAVTKGGIEDRWQDRGTRRPHTVRAIVTLCRWQRVAKV